MITCDATKCRSDEHVDIKYVNSYEYMRFDLQTFRS